MGKKRLMDRKIRFKYDIQTMLEIERQKYEHSLTSAPPTDDDRQTDSLKSWLHFQ